MMKEMNCQVDAVLMDYRMPVMNGLDATNELLRLCPDLVIVFVSADDSIKRESLATGAKLFIPKPFEFDSLIYSIEEVIASSG